MAIVFFRDYGLNIR